MKLSAVVLAAATVLAATNAARAPLPNEIPGPFYPPHEGGRRLEGMAARAPESVLKAQKKMQPILDPTTLVPQVEKRRLEEMAARAPESVLKAQKKMQPILDPTTLVPQVEKRNLRAEDE